MKWIVTIDGKYKYTIEGEKDFAEAMAVRYAQRDHGLHNPDQGRVTDTKEAPS